MKTAVEWLESEMLEHYSPFDNKLLYEAIHKAKEMFEKQIIESYKAGVWDLGCRSADSEEYYNRTFKQQEQ